MMTTPPMLAVHVRPEEPADCDRIGAINDAAFGGPVEAGIVAALRGTDRWIDGGSLVAETEAGEVIGHVLLSIGDLLADDGSVRPIWVLGPVSVLPEHQGRGVGAALMRAAIEVARGHHQPLVCLLGHAEYYPRFGFERARPIGILPPAPYRDENWQALRLPGWTPVMRGTVRYPPAFPKD
ncbi:MAG: N-acetyltransferase [Chloroflexi bacterium]|nr:N-acetyltransferase [Chloroflexota bacterium]